MIVRIGDLAMNWDDAYLVNLLVRDLDKSAAANAVATSPESDQP